MIFGNSRGEYPIDREVFQDVYFEDFVYKINCDGYGYFDNQAGFENEVFKIMPYDWDAECDCGYDELEEQWWETHKHTEKCYQTLLYNEKLKNGWKKGKYSWLDEPKNLSYERCNKIEDEIYKKLCNKFNLPLQGCAVHCTCSVDNEFEKWCESYNHKESCRLLKPNFWYKPTGFKINWYKYALRDSYINQDISVGEFKKILAHCVESYKDKGD